MRRAGGTSDKHVLKTMKYGKALHCDQKITTGQRHHRFAAAGKYAESFG